MDLTRRHALLLALAVLGAIGGLVAADQLIERVSPWDYDDLERWMEDLGAWGPLLYILAFAGSMVVAPVPTAPAPFAAAAAFGGVAAFFYTLLAGMLGASACFWIARRWGRPALRRILPARVADEIDRLSRALGLRVLFVMRLFPIFGVDVVSYGAGLTPIRFLAYLSVSILGSAPVLVLVSVVGEGLREDRTTAAAGLGALALFLLLPVAYLGLRRRRRRTPPPDAAPASVERAAGDAR